MNLLVNIDVDDLDRGVAFYTAAFGLKVGRRLGRFAIELLGASAPIYLLAKRADTLASDTTAQRRTYERHWTPVHLDVVVDDIEQATNKALAAGAQLEKPISTHRWGKLALLSDPFGHGVCLVEFLGRGYDEIADDRAVRTR